jgi:hypothetical protein
VKSLAVLNAVREEAEALLFEETRLTLEERVSAPLPDEALTSISVSPSEAEEAEEAEEELSSDFAQPMITKLMIPRKISKFVKFFISTSLKNKVNNQKTDTQLCRNSDDMRNERNNNQFIPIKISVK